MLAQILAEAINPLVDFCGHIGGDDFMVLFQSDDWESRFVFYRVLDTDNIFLAGHKLVKGCVNCRGLAASCGAGYYYYSLGCCGGFGWR